MSKKNELKLCVLSRQTHFIILEGHSIGTSKINTSISRFAHKKNQTFWNSQLYLASTWQNDKSDCPQQSSILESHLALFVSSQAWVGSNVISLCTSVNLMPLAATDTQNTHAKWIGVLISIIQSGFIKPWVTCIQIHVCHVDSVINQELCSVLWSSPDTDFMDTDAWVR